MRGYTHLTFSICALPLLPNSEPATLLGLLAGSLAPDVDVKGSPASRVIYIPVKHRTFFHSLTACALLTAVLFFLSKNFAMGFLAGYLSHLFLDMLNVAGVPLFYPFNKRHFHIARIKVGSVFEYILLLVFAVFDFFMVISFLGKIGV